MTFKGSRSAIALSVLACVGGATPSVAWAQAGNISKDMETYCVNDYKKFCGEYGLQTSALNLCMKKAGPSLSPACVKALVRAGKISQAEVDRIKAQMGR
ncbi:hypothetical protein [Methyloceanibacter caenitepidi]|uniref:hypothetical protein n=1 Tax=Methyloceanibacter caenitepidi TaxID=1384459 RepID=UPI0005EF2137|nr:hypothetical protein [Methyloceanibacter caenitepidi]